MRKTRRNKIIILSLSLLFSGLATALVLFSLKQNINFYYTPTELLNSHSVPQGEIKLGGMVKHYKAKRIANTLQVNFIVSDFEHQVPVSYQGILPDLFREDKGVVVQGTYIDGHFNASQVLAKHDENYMPPKIKGEKPNAS